SRSSPSVVNPSCPTTWRSSPVRSSRQAFRDARRAAGRKRLSGVTLYLGQELIEALTFGPTERIHDHSIDSPVVVLPVGNVAPRRQSQTRNGARPRLHPPPMLAKVGAHHFDVDVARARVSGHALPLAPGQLDGIARVRGDADPEA